MARLYSARTNGDQRPEAPISHLGATITQASTLPGVTFRELLMQKKSILLALLVVLFSTSALPEEDEDMYLVVIPEGDKVSIVARSPTATGHRDTVLSTEPIGDDRPFVSTAPSDCAECGSNCLRPHLMWGNDETYAYGGGLIHMTADQPTKCIRSDGFDFAEDGSIFFFVTNRTQSGVFLRVLESGELLFERHVAARESIEEELIPSADRRYTYSISLDPENTRELPVKAGFSISRYVDVEGRFIGSLVQIGIGAEHR